jgi:DNA-binding NtrC family response regulator
MYGHSRSMLKLFEQIRKVAKAGGPVLIFGESGTGKELVAQAIHKESRGRDQTFLAVNCAGIPEHLLESEYFGHESGAFTGAGKSRRGLFAEAEGGTLLLDEISEMPISLQAKLLRMLQDGKIRPVGGNREQQVNVRVLAATHQDLEEEVRRGHFRQDLFYRLETFTLRVPPLRERGEDIDLLVGHFLQKFTLRSRKFIKGFSADAFEIMRRYPFPGNVRELQNAVERAVTFCQEDKILPEHLPPRIRNASSSDDSVTGDFLAPSTTTPTNLPPLAEIENRYIRHVLHTVKGNKRRAAAILGIGRRTLYRRLGIAESE